MAAVPSTMLELGTPIPDFSLPDAVSGARISPAAYAGRPALLVMFICNHCPYVQHVLPELARLERDFGPLGLALVAINSNDVDAWPDDAPPRMAALAREQGWGFPFLFDEAQEVARAFRAACTPDFFLFDRDRRLVYRGQLDDSRPKNGLPVTGNDLRQAVEATLAGRPVAPDQRPSVGCNIKWKAGTAPAWFGQ
jgi:thiol-disulfide isomerase/thioredoxin